MPQEGDEGGLAAVLRTDYEDAGGCQWQSMGLIEAGKLT